MFPGRADITTTASTVVPAYCRRTLPRIHFTRVNVTRLNGAAISLPSCRIADTAPFAAFLPGATAFAIYQR